MPTFVYAGRRRLDGRAVSGTREAVSADAVAAQLRREAVVVTRLVAQPVPWSGTTGRGVGARRLAAATRQLAVMLAAGLPLVQALDVLARQASPRRFAAALGSLTETVARGTALSEAMRRHPRLFGRVYARTVAAGERAGALAATLGRLADHLERQAALRRRLQTALAYPAVVTLVTMAVVLLLVWRIVPAFAALFDGLGAPLPWLTRVVVAVSTELVARAPVLLALLALAALGLRVARRAPGVRRFLDRGLLALPGIGRLARDAATAASCRTLSTLVAAGVPLIEALDETASTARNRAVAAALREARALVAGGELLSTALAATGPWTPLMLQLVEVGQTTGSLDAMLARAAEAAEASLDAATQAIVVLAEPALILILGLVVGGVVLALYLPLFELIGRLA